MGRMNVNNQCEDNSTVMRDSFSQLDPSATKFLLQEFALSLEEFNKMSEDDLGDLYDQLCEIEHAETPSNNSPLTARGSMVEYIVTIVGNYFSEKLGYWEESE